VLVEAYKRNRSKAEMAQALADAIRAKFLANNRHPHGHHDFGEAP
jgi:hypothetical protein